MIFALWATPVSWLHIRAPVSSELAVAAPLIVTLSTAWTTIAPPSEFTLARSPILATLVDPPSRGNLNWRPYCATCLYTSVQRMHVNQRFIGWAQHSFHSPKRLPSDDSDTGSQSRRAPLKRDQEPTFVRLSGHSAGETHGSAAAPTIHEGCDCRHGHSREAYCR